MQPLAPLAEAVAATPRHDFDPVPDVDLEHLLETEGLRLALHERDVIDAERILEGRQPIQLLEHGIRVETGLDADHQLKPAMAVGEVGDVGDALQFLGCDGVLDLLDHPLGADEVGKLGDDQAGAARPQGFDRDFRAGSDRAAALGVSILHPVEADDDSARREVGPGNKLHELFDGRFRMIEQMDGGGDHLDEVVRRHVRGHAHRDARRPVDEQVRERCRQHRGLLELPVIVRDEVDDVFIQVLGQREGGCGQSGLGVPRSGRPVIQ